MEKELDQYYDLISSSYAELHGEEQREKLNRIIELLENDSELVSDPNIMLLDIGCGTGISTSDLSYPRAGLDPAIELLTQANTERFELISKTNQLYSSTNRVHTALHHLGYIRGVAEALPIKTKSCGIVISVTAVHNFHDIDKGIQEINRIAINRVVITVLKHAKMFEEIVEIINQNFQVLKSIENRFDLILYLAPKN